MGKPHPIELRMRLSRKAIPTGMPPDISVFHHVL
jgi:hypothetical protein